MPCSSEMISQNWGERCERRRDIACRLGGSAWSDIGLRVSGTTSWWPSWSYCTVLHMTRCAVAGAHNLAVISKAVTDRIRELVC